MKVFTSTPFPAPTGTVLSPSIVNDGFAYARNALVDVASRRWLLGTLVFPFSESAAVPYTQAMGAEQRSWRFVAPQTMTIERAFLQGNYTSTGEVQIAITTAAGATPSGATTPWLALPLSTDATVDAFDINAERVLLVGGTTYVVTVSAAAAIVYSLKRFDLVLHTRADRWMRTGTSLLPALAPPTFTDASTLDASAIAALQTAQSTAAGLLVAERSTPIPLLVTAPQLSSAAAQKFFFPYFEIARTELGGMSRADLFVVPTSVGTSTTITATITDPGGGTVTSAAVTYTSASTIQTAAWGIGFFNNGTAGVSADPAQDWSVEFTSTSATAAIKAYAVLWF